ncbi:MAG: colanic acid biosynthesis glycosyltransferase WcaL [Nitrospirales bacterium]|nr:MAG: colanic acid biosynthesis glycosyltransferase WcaL [Nitrospirales bacterium]
MRILYICNNLATFILNEIVELKQLGHEILILAEGNSRIHQVLNEPIINQHGLENGFYRFSRASTRREKYVAFTRGLIRDFLSHPISVSKACLHLLTHYPSPKYGIVDYLDIRHFFDKNIDVIHSPFSIPSVIDKVSLLSEILNVPYTLSFKAHDIWERENLSGSKERINKVKGASRIFTIAKYNRDYLMTQLELNEDIDVIHDAIDVDMFKRIESRNSKNSIIAVARLASDKGLHYLIKACHILHQRNVEYACTIVGEGPEKQVYEALIRELHIPNICFTGYLSNDQVCKLLQSQTVFVLPSIIHSNGHSDILANVIKEAMAMQLPVVTSNIRGVDELVIDEVNGLLVPPDNFVAIADAIERIFKHPDLGRKMGQQGRVKVEQEFNIKTEVRKIEKIFVEVCGEKKG